MKVKELMTSDVKSCNVDETMTNHRVRRLPVVDNRGQLTGIVTIHDVALQARAHRNSGIPPEAVLDALIAITAPARTAAPA